MTAPPIRFPPATSSDIAGFTDALLRHVQDAAPVRHPDGLTAAMTLPHPDLEVLLAKDPRTVPVDHYAALSVLLALSGIPEVVALRIAFAKGFAARTAGDHSTIERAISAHHSWL